MLYRFYHKYTIAMVILYWESKNVSMNIKKSFRLNGCKCSKLHLCSLHIILNNLHPGYVKQRSFVNGTFIITFIGDDTLSAFTQYVALILSKQHNIIQYNIHVVDMIKITKRYEHDSEHVKSKKNRV